MMKLANKGFTLLELMITAAILSIAVAGALFAFVNCILLNEYNSELTIAVNDAQYVLERVKSLAYSNITAGYTPPQFTHLRNENISFTLPTSATWYKEIAVNVNWTNKRGRARSLALSTRVAK